MGRFVAFAGLFIAILSAEPAAAVDVTIDGRDLSDPAGQLILMVPTKAQWRGSITLTNVADGTYDVLVRTGAPLGTFTISGGALTSWTGTLVLTAPNTLGFDKTQLTSVKIPLGQLSIPANRRVVEVVDATGFLSFDQTLWLPAGTYTIRSSSTTKPPSAGVRPILGMFEVSPTGALTNLTGTLIPGPGGLDFDLTKMVKVTVDARDLSVPTARVETRLGVLARGFSTAQVYLVPAVYEVFTGDPGDASTPNLGTFRVESDLSLSVVAAGPGQAVVVDNVTDTVSFDLSKLAEVKFQSTTSTSPAGLSSSVIGPGGLVLAPPGVDMLLYLPPARYKVFSFQPTFGVTPPTVGFFTVEDLSVTGTEGGLSLDSPNEVVWDPCKLNALRVTPLPGGGWAGLGYRGINPRPDPFTFYTPDVTNLGVVLAFPTDQVTVTISNGMLSDTQVPTNAPRASLELIACAPNTPPVADAGDDLSGGCSGQITLDGTRSSDVDGDSLTHVWSGPFLGGTATGATPTVTLSLGTHLITLTVDDGNGGTDTDTVTVTVSPCPCPRSQGFWKNHPDDWSVTELTLGSETYTKAELLDLLRTPPRGGDASMIMGHQLIATKLNLAAGTDPAPITHTVTDADAVLTRVGGRLPLRVRSNTTDGQEMVALSDVLDQYNNGLLTPDCGAAIPASGPADPGQPASTPPSQANGPANVGQPVGDPLHPTASAVNGVPPGSGSSGGAGCVLDPAPTDPGSAAWLLLLLAGLVRLRTRVSTSPRTNVQS